MLCVLNIEAPNLDGVYFELSDTRSPRGPYQATESDCISWKEKSPCNPSESDQRWLSVITAV